MSRAIRFVNPQQNLALVVELTDERLERWRHHPQATGAQRWQRFEDREKSRFPSQI